MAAAAAMTSTRAVLALPLILIHDSSTALTALLAVALTAVLVVSIQRRAAEQTRRATSSPPPSFASSFSADEEEEDDDELYTSDEGIEDEEDLQAISTIPALDSPTAPQVSLARLRNNAPRRRAVGGSVSVSAAYSHANSTLVLITSRDPTSNLCFRPAQVFLQAPPTHPPGHHPRVASRLASRVSSSPSRSPTVSPRSSPRLANASAWGTAPPAAPERNSSYHKAYDEQQRTPRIPQPAIPSILRKQGQTWQSNDGAGSEPGSTLSPSPSSSQSPLMHTRSYSQPSPSRSIHLTEPDWDLYVSFHIRAQERQAKRQELKHSSTGTAAAATPLDPVAQDWLHYTSFLDAGDNDGPETSPSATTTDDFWYERFTPSTAAAGRNWDWRKRRAMQRRLALVQDVRAIEHAEDEAVTGGSNIATVAAGEETKKGDDLDKPIIDRKEAGNANGGAGQATLSNRPSTNVKPPAQRQQPKRPLRPRASQPLPTPGPVPPPPRRASSNSIVTSASTATKKPPTDYGSLPKHNGDVSFFPTPTKKGVFV